MNEQTRCRSCQEPVAWGETAGGKRAPFNVSDGQNHFVSCPQKREWRKTYRAAPLPGFDDVAPRPEEGRKSWTG